MATTETPGPRNTSRPGQGRGKRRLQVVVACNECRRRKVKCDGNRPNCWFCSSRGITCQYDADPDAPPITALKRKYEQLQRDYSDRDDLIRVLVTASDGETRRILSTIRSGSDISAALQSARNVRSPSRNPDGSVTQRSLTKAIFSLHSPCKCSIFRRRLSDATETRPPAALRRVRSSSHQRHDFLRKSSVSASPYFGDGRDRVPPHVNIQDWGVTYLDNDCFRDILSSYMAWDHPSYRFFDEYAFMNGLRNGPSEFCSSLLVHSVVFVGCKSYSYTNPERAGIVEHFALVEAKKLWVLEATHDSPATVAAGLMIHLGLGCMGLDREGYPYLAQALHMSENLGFYTPSLTGDVYDPSSPFRMRGNLILAWGCFIYRCLFSMIMHDMSLSGNTAAPPFRLSAEDPDDDCYPWQPWPKLEPRLPCLKNELHRARSSFFCIAAEVPLLHSRHNSQQIGPEYLRSAFEIYERLRGWYSDLHPVLLQITSAPPQLISLHNDYHYVVTELFSPFVSSAESSQPTPVLLQREGLPPGVPLTASSTASRKLRQLVELYDQLYHGMPVSATFFTTRLLVCFESMPRADVTRGDSDSQHAFLICLLLFRRLSRPYPYHRHTLMAICRAATRMKIHLPPAALRVFKLNEEERQAQQNSSRVHSSWLADVSLKFVDPHSGRLSNLIKKMEATGVSSELDNPASLQYQDSEDLQKPSL